MHGCGGARRRGRGGEVIGLGVVRRRRAAYGGNGRRGRRCVARFTARRGVDGKVEVEAQPLDLSRAACGRRAEQVVEVQPRTARRRERADGLLGLC